MQYEGAEIPGANRTRVLTVREQGAWWIATPKAFNPMAAFPPPAERELDEQYRELVDAAAEADRQFQSGRDATTEVDGDLSECPADGASSARDASGDIKVANGGTRAEEQPGAHDLTGVTHNADGASACFELRFAADAPEEGGVEIAVPPDGRQVQVRWAEDEAVGEYGGDDDATAVKVAVARRRSTMTFRLPADSLGIGSGPYRWAVELFTPTEDRLVHHYDHVPDDLTVSGDADGSIRHGG